MIFNRICKKISSVLAVITGILFTGVLLLSVVNILLRNVFLVSWLSSDVLMKLMFVWMIFLGACSAYYHADHLKMDFLSSRFRGRAKLILELIMLAVSLVLLAVMVIYGFNISMVRMTIPFESNKAIPTAYLFLAVPVSAIIMIVFSANHLVNLLRLGSVKGETPPKK